MGTEGVGKVLEERRKEKHKFIYTKKKQSCVAQHFLALCIYIYEAYEGTDIRPHFGWSRLQLIKGEARGGEDSPEVSGYNGTGTGSPYLSGISGLIFLPHFFSSCLS